MAARIAVSNLHKQTKKGFLEVMTDLRNYINPKTGAKAPLVSDDSVARQQAGCQRQQFVATLPHALRLTARTLRSL